MSFQAQERDVAVLLRVFQDRVGHVLNSVQGFPFDASAQVVDDAFTFERVFPTHKCILKIGLRLTDPEEGPHLCVILQPYRISGGARRMIATMTLTGRPQPDGTMAWLSTVERHNAKGVSPPIKYFIRRFQALSRMKGFEPDEIADERIHLLTNFAMRGPLSLV